MTIAVQPGPAPAFEAAVRRGGGAVGPLGADTDGLVWLSYDDPAGLDRVLVEHPGIRWVQLPFAGVDAFAPVFAAHRARRTVWTSAKGAYAEPVAEHALALTLALLRDLPTRARATSWGRKSGRTLHRSRVLIVGAGGIAQEVIRLLGPFDTEITVLRRSGTPVDGAVRTITTASLDEVLPGIDVVVLAAAATSETSGLFGAARFDALPAHAVLVNVARGALVDTEALARALGSGAIAGAAIDVTDPEPLPDGHALWSEPRCLITPHSADTPEMTAPLLAARIATNVRAHLGDGDPVGVVDLESGY